MAAVSLIEHGEATSEAAIRQGLEGNLCRCTGYHNIVVAVGRGRDGESVMSATGDDRLRRLAASSARRTRRSCTGRGHVRRQHGPAGHGRDGGRAQPVRARADRRASTRPRRGRPRASSRSFTGADLQRRLEGGDAVRLAGHRGHEEPAALSARADEARYQGDGVAVVIADTRAHAEDAAELVEVDYEPLDAVVDVAQRARRTARRSCTRISARTSATSGSSTPTRPGRRSRTPTSS